MKMQIVEEQPTQYEVEPSGHIDQMLRQTRMHHAQLSQMADVKASMILTLASIIITFSIGYLDDPILRWPVVIMIIFCAITIITAAYAVLPKIELKAAPQKDATDRNILFFGSFVNLDYDQYCDAMHEVLQDPNRVYDVMLREVYELGVYLGRKKYRYIRIAYTAFLCGLILSLLAITVSGGYNLLSSF